jgi:uncharacterized protein YukE
MSGYSVDLDQLRAAAADLDSKLSRAYDLVREVDSLAVPTASFGGIADSVAATYAGAHQRKVASLDSVVRALRDAGDMTSAVADMYQARDDAAAEAMYLAGWRLR